MKFLKCVLVRLGNYFHPRATLSLFRVSQAKLSSKVLIHNLKMGPRGLDVARVSPSWSKSYENLSKPLL